MNNIKAVQLIGNKKSGKTTLAIELTKIFKQKGLRVACIKYTHHNLDRRDSDTEKLSKNANLVVGISDHCSEIIFDHKKKFLDIVSYLNNVDVLIVEGGKQEINFLPKILVSSDKENYLKDELIIAVYSPSSHTEKTKEQILKLAELILDKGFFLPGIDCNMCGEESCKDMGIKILTGKANIHNCVSLKSSKLEIKINGIPLSLNPFIQEIICSTIYGLLSPLKGFHNGEIEIKIKK